MNNIINFKELNINDINQVGGKNASLGEMIQNLSKLNIKIPEGFATTVSAYQQFLNDNQLSEKIYSALDKLDVENVEQLKKTGATIREWILQATLSKNFCNDVAKAYQQHFNQPDISVAVRSSATAEDLPEASFAGQQETYLNVQTEKNVFDAIKKVYASLFTERAIAYRVHHGFPHQKVGISAGIQRMIRSDLAASGVAFTIDTESGFDKVILINAAYGLGETIVKGAINPDEFYVYKPNLEKNKPAIIRRNLGSKTHKMIYADNGQQTKTIPVPTLDSAHFSLSDQEVEHLAQQSLFIEQHYGKPMDVEWAKDGIDQEIYIVQARPETIQSQRQQNVLEQYQLLEKSEVITQGRSVGQRIGQGKARIVTDPKNMTQMRSDEVLVTDMTDPDWEPIMKQAAAIVTNRGGRTCHAAIVAREHGIPAIVGCTDATTAIKENNPITVSCAEGEEGYVYNGLLKFNIEKTEIGKLAELPVKLCMNLANPEQAFTFQFLPNDGVGLARLEFIISSMIGIHPNTLLNYDTLPEALKHDLALTLEAYASPTEFYIEKLKEGIATIAAAFYPKPVIVRFSDFKTNEYANLVGGKLFEPKEENPMLGFRGGSRYINDKFRECFRLECEAIKRVRNDMDLTNTQVMFPFVRTIDEIKNLIETTQSFGLERGVNDLKIYMMCEIPSNVLLAEEFLEYVDGYSIGSNDLTQLTLGLDRDSELVADIFDERNAAVKKFLTQAIQICNQRNKYVGICGQGPSDYPDLAKWLIEQGIQSISLTPDSIIPTWLKLGKAYS